MSPFVHCSVRLYADALKAWRHFHKPELLSRWLCTEAEVLGDSEYHLTGISDPGDRWVLHLEEQARERHLRFRSQGLPGIDDTERLLEIRFMKCTSLTEYCTEIHLIHEGFTPSDADTRLRKVYEAFWTARLEALRALMNGTWVIEDKDLTLDLFK